MGWPVTPSGLGRMLGLLQEYGTKAVYVTENGSAYPDPTPKNGLIDDERRRHYLEVHLDEAARAIKGGAPLKGYFAWTLLDNFEWALGYSRRFGLIHVDFPTGKRTPKASAHWYRKTISSHRH